VLTQERLAEILALAGFVLVVLGFVTGPQIVCVREPCGQPLNVPVLLAGVTMLVIAVAWTVALRLRGRD
jgi:hypothetical protein